MKKSSSTILFSLLLSTAIVFAISAEVSHDASAYVKTCKWSSNTVTWKSINMTATDLADTKLAIANWNDVGSNLFLDETTTGQNIATYSVNRPDLTSTLGFTTYTPCSGTFTGVVSIYINDALTNSFSSQKRQNVAAHEFGHAVGLDHPGALTTLMYSTNTSYTTYNIFVPVLDDIRGVQDWYGIPSSTSECTAFNQNGVVTYTGTCSASNPALPMTETVTTAGAQNRAFASDSTSGRSLPSADTALITVKVKPNTLYRYSMGIHTDSNVASQTSRFATIEIRDSNIVASWTSGGVAQTSAIWVGTPSTTTTYFLELVVQNGKPAAAYAYKDDASPTWLGKASFTPGLAWSGTKYIGTGVWTDGTSNPKSDYTVSQYYDRLKSYT